MNLVPRAVPVRQIYLCVERISAALGKLHLQVVKLHSLQPLKLLPLPLLRVGSSLK